MKKIKKLYCELCGSILRWYDGEYFDPNTGKRERYLACSNQNCQEGCFEHIEKGFFERLFDNSCRRCGKGLGTWSMS